MSMDKTFLQLLVRELQSKGVAFDRGLNDNEVLQIERDYEFRFPPDLRSLLQFALPISESFPNWRKGWMAQPIIEWQDRTPIVRGHNLVSIEDRFAGPAEGICFDVEHSGFWIPEWGAKPEDLSAAKAVARRKLAQVPKLIPIYSHRFLPSEPCDSGNPIFSVYQTDIIYYGFDLASYLAHEFEITAPNWAATEAREISFWSKLAN
jgi:hypothetical protein